jgi:hypothetical protein
MSWDTVCPPILNLPIFILQVLKSNRWYLKILNNWKISFRSQALFGIGALFMAYRMCGPFTHKPCKTHARQVRIQNNIFEHIVI